MKTKNSLSLESEINLLRELIEQIPSDRVIDRSCLESRLSGLEKELSFEEDFIPEPGSLWLVNVECRPNVIRVCGSGKGFYIPGQEPCWPFRHVDTWIREIVP